MKLVERHLVLRAEKSSQAAEKKLEQNRNWRQRLREKNQPKQKPAPKEEAIDVGQMDMLDPAPRTFRINLAPKVYMRLRKAAREMNTPISELASMILAAGLHGREQE